MLGDSIQDTEEDEEGISFLNEEDEPLAFTVESRTSWSVPGSSEVKPEPSRGASLLSACTTPQGSSCGHQSGHARLTRQSIMNWGRLAPVRWEGVCVYKV